MLRLDPLYRAARATGAQLSLTLSVPITNRSDQPGLTSDPTFPGVDTYAASADYRSLWWFGHLFHFNPPQADIVRVLITTYEDGIDWVLEQQLREAAGTTRPLASLFRGHPAWGLVILPARDQPGAWRLNPTRNW